MFRLLRFFVLAIALQQTLAGYKKLSDEEAARLQSWTGNEKQKMWEVSGQVEGDMLLRPGQRNGIIGASYRWPNNVIPYEIDPIFSDAQVRTIDESLQEYAQKSCVTVRRRQGESDYVYVTGENTGCWSWVGRLGGKQELNLQTNGCVWHDTIVHEFLHAAGFYHQQSATERDDYVDIMWENIMEGTEHNFDKYGADYITSFGQTYDYYSVMHYSAYAFSSNGEKTIVAKDPSVVLGEAPEMSEIDAIKLNIMYNC